MFFNAGESLDLTPARLRGEGIVFLCLPWKAGTMPVHNLIQDKTFISVILKYSGAI